MLKKINKFGCQLFRSCRVTTGMVRDKLAWCLLGALWINLSGFMMLVDTTRSPSIINVFIASGLAHIILVLLLIIAAIVLYLWEKVGDKCNDIVEYINTNISKIPKINIWDRVIFKCQRKYNDR